MSRSRLVVIIWIYPPIRFLSAKRWVCLKLRLRKRINIVFFCLVSLKPAPNKGTPSLISRDAPGGCGALLHLSPRQTAWPPPSLHRPGLDEGGGRSRSGILPTRYPLWSLHVSKKPYKSHPLRFCFHWDTPICLWGSSTKPLA